MNRLTRRAGLANALLMATVAAMAVVAAGASARVAAQEPAQATTYRFGVYYGDRRIGSHVYEVTADATTTRVASRAEFQVKVLFVTAYRYRHQANELWRNGCLAGLSSVTDDNGERYQIEARRREAGLRLTSLQPRSDQITLDSACPGGFAYWDRTRLTGDALINAQTGAISAATLIEQGPDRVDGTDAVRYRLEADGVAPITLWYRRSDDAWMRLETRRDGTALQYRLEALQRRPVSAIEQDARVEDPPGI